MEFDGILEIEIGLCIHISINNIKNRAVVIDRIWTVKKIVFIIFYNKKILEL